MNNPDRTWRFFHTDIYTRMVASLRASPPTPPVGNFLRHEAPIFFEEHYDKPYGYLITSNGKGLAYGPIAVGDDVVFWNGVSVIMIPFDAYEYWTQDFHTLAFKTV